MDSRTEKIYLGKARHNLKNPINAILGYSEMLIEDCEDLNLDSIIRDLEKIHESGKNILKIIENNFKDESLNRKDSTINSIAKNTQIHIRTPLNTIIGYSEIIIEDLNSELEKTFKPDLERIISSGKSLENEIENIINFKSLDPTNKSNSSTQLELVESVIGSIRPISKDKSQKIVTGKILAVDDNINNTNILKKRLQKKGHTVETANNGEDALSILIEDNSYDLILLDIVMPIMNGFDLLKVIKKDQRLHMVPVIMVSSMDDIDSIYRCIELGADDYVTKPYDKSILDIRITSCIEKKQLRDKEKLLLEEIKKEKIKSDNLLLNILPKDIANRLKSGEKIIADKHNQVSVLFADIVEFTPQSKNLNPKELVSILNIIFSNFDDLSTKYHIEKIKTIGDNYFAVSGLKSDGRKSAINLINMAKEMIITIKSINDSLSTMNVALRIGIHTGPIVAGVIGKNKFAYDLWGSTVNMASRMESTGKKNKIQISENTHRIIKADFKFQKRKEVKVKGIGLVNTYLIS